MQRKCDRDRRAIVLNRSEPWESVLKLRSSWGQQLYDRNIA